MKVAILGRSGWLLDAARAVLDAGHAVPLIATRPAAEHETIGPADFQRLAAERGAAFLQGPLNHPETIEQITRARCDVAISLNWPTLIRAETLALFRLGIINAHAGDLPRYRGNACPNWAIINGEPHIGLCAHRMVPELDAGPVLVRDRFALTPATYIGDVYGWLAARVPSLFVEAIERAERPGEDQDEQNASRCYPRRPEDAAIDWRRPADAVHRLIRASSRPFQGAYTTLEGRQRVRVWRATPVAHPGQWHAVPGQVCYRIEGDPVIACGDGLLRLNETTFDDGTDARPAVASSLRNRLA